MLLARTTAQLQAVERELAEERVKLEYTEEEVLEMERKEEQAEAVSERWAPRGGPGGEAAAAVVASVGRTGPPFGTLVQKSGISRGTVG